MYRFCLLTFILIVISCNSQNRKTIENNVDSSLNLQSCFSGSYKYSTLIVINPDRTFGYIIYNDSMPFINQKNIPGTVGNKGFDDSLSASKVANFVVYKLKRNIMPPTINKHELDSLLKFKLNHE